MPDWMFTADGFGTARNTEPILSDTSIRIGDRVRVIDSDYEFPLTSGELATVTWVDRSRSPDVQVHLDIDGDGVLSWYPYSALEVVNHV